VPTIAHKALRPIALFEALKGAGGLIVGFVALGFMDRDNEAYAQQIIHHLHIDPTWRYAQWFIRLVADASDSQIMAVVGFFALYAAVRFVEAYGLWHERRWAEWLAALSGGVYVPIEVYELVHRASWLKAVTILLNLLVVGYMFWLLTETQRKRRLAEKKLTAAGG
jgi:uncharacterized membrane protein (DUF2068 family)